MKPGSAWVGRAPATTPAHATTSVLHCFGLIICPLSYCRRTGASILGVPQGGFWDDCAAALTSATTPARIAGGRSGHAATTAANSGSVGVAGVGEGGESPPCAPDCAPLWTAPPLFPAGNRGSSDPVAPIVSFCAGWRVLASACETSTRHAGTQFVTPR